MSHERISLANGKVFHAADNATILDAARDEGFILEHSCRTGRCGVCKARVISGDTKVLTDETSLQADDLSAGYILTCCRAAASNLQLDIDDLGDLAKFERKTVPARIDTIKAHSSDVLEVVLRTPPTNILNFRAGQYIDVIGPQGVRRSYSIANAPRSNGKLTLQIRRVENGQLSQYWFNEAQANDLLRLEGPLGTFCLRNMPSKNLIMLATGTGIAPIKAILEELSERTDVFENHQIHLYWGGRVRDDLYWSPEFPNLPLNFVRVLSRAKDWRGRVGYVQDAVLADGIDLSEAAVYACGSELMIDSARSALSAAGLNINQFYSDAFVSSN